MTLGTVATFTMPALVFACGAALLSYRFYAAYRGWALKDFSYKSHLPGILGTAAMLFAILLASSLGWIHVVATVLGGFAVSYLYVYVFRMRPEVALLCPVLVVLSIILIPGT